MNYYIDFDSTLYNTSKLKQEMLETIARDVVLRNKDVNFESILFECKTMFCRDKIYNIYKLCDYFSEKYKIGDDILKNDIDNLLLHGEKFVYEDSLPFLTKLKEEGHFLNLLTFASEDNQTYQEKKIEGSGLKGIFDKIIITSQPKHLLDLDFQNSIFIDDNPNDLLNLYSKNPLKIIRIRREGNSYSKIEINTPQINEFMDLSLTI